MTAANPRLNTRVKRVAYAEAGLALRQMHERLRAVAADLAPLDIKVAFAAACHTVSWSRTGDYVTREQIADTVGCNHQRAGKSLTKLARLGVLTWEPRGRSWLCVTPPDETSAVSSGLSSPRPQETAAGSANETNAVFTTEPRSSAEEIPDRSRLVGAIREWPGIDLPQVNEVLTACDRLARNGWREEDLWRLLTRSREGRGVRTLFKRLQMAGDLTIEEARRTPILDGLLRERPAEGRFGFPPGTAADFGATRRLADF